jgi:hypothetical protein
MNKLTKTYLENLQENDVIFVVNPYEETFDKQEHVKIKRIVVSTVIDGKITSTSSYEPETIEHLNSLSYIDDMLRGDIKGVFSTHKEAYKYLKLVHHSKFSKEVKNHHDSLWR